MLHFFSVCNPRPHFQYAKTSQEQEEVDQGALLFDSIGCTECHKPFLTTYDFLLPMQFPEDEFDPYKD